MSLANFDPKELRSIADFCGSGEIPLSGRRVRELCRLKKFPAVKVGRNWMTTSLAVKEYLYSRSNAWFRRMTA